MALRLVEALVPKAAAERVEGVLANQAVMDSWQTTAAHDRVSIRILIDAADTDAVLNSLEEECGGLEGFRVALLPVEATIPRDEPEPESGAEPEEESDKTHATRVSVEELYEDIGDMIRSGRVFHILLILSTVVGAIGLYRSDVAIIIGAMVIAPLLGPSVATSLAVTLADLKLGARAALHGTVGLLVAIGIAGILGWFYNVPLDASGAIASDQIAARTQVGMADIALALAAGTAGALSITTGASTALMGVMVAVALLPPLVVAGLLLGSGMYLDAWAASVLVMVNLVCINLSGVVTFLVQGIRPRLGWGAEAARRLTVTAILLWTSLLVALALLLWYRPPDPSGLP